MKSNWPVGAVILAAGQSSRMGNLKPLLPWHEENTIIRWIASQILSCQLQETLLITGREAEAVAAQVSDLPVQVVHNPRYAEGEMISSLQVGLSALSARCRACMVVMGDQPAIQQPVIEALLSAYSEGKGRIVAPTFQSQRGHPVIIDRAFWPDLLALPATAAPRDVLKAHPEDLYLLEVDTPSILQDIDTPEDYDQASHKNNFGEIPYNGSK